MTRLYQHSELKGLAFHGKRGKRFTVNAGAQMMGQE